MGLKEYFRAHNALRRSWAAFLKANPGGHAAAPGLTALQICHYVESHPECALNDVAEALGITLGAASQLVETLRKRSLICRTESRIDRRRLALAVTPVTREFLQSCEKSGVGAQ